MNPSATPLQNLFFVLALILALSTLPSCRNPKSSRFSTRSSSRKPSKIPKHSCGMKRIIIKRYVVMMFVPFHLDLPGNDRDVWNWNVFVGNVHDGLTQCQHLAGQGLFSEG